MSQLLILFAVLNSLLISVVDRTPIEYVYEVNTDRSAVGLQSLTIDTDLVESACAKAKHMTEENYWSHDTPEGVKFWHFISDAGYIYDRAGENLARGYNSPQQAEQALMDSPTHRDNILGDWSDVGVCLDQYKDGQTLVVQHFGKKLIDK